MGRRMNLSLTSGTILAMLLLAGGPVHAQGAWSVSGQLTAERSESAAAVINGKIYVLGGTALGREDSPINQEFDPASKNWRASPRGHTRASPGLRSVYGQMAVARADADEEEERRHRGGPRADRLFRRRMQEPADTRHLRRKRSLRSQGRSLVEPGETGHGPAR